MSHPGYQPMNAGYPPPNQPGYPPPNQPGYPPPNQAGYPPPNQAGYPPPNQAGYSPPNQAGYPPPNQGGYPPPQMGFASPPQTGYVPQQQQPAPGQWMMAPQPPLNCPPGLEYLTQIDQLLVHQKTELLEAFTGFETANKYSIKNSLGQKVYFAVEDTDCCTRNCCGPGRPFQMQIMDNNQHEKLEVTSPPGTVIGYIEQNWSLCAPKFSILDENEEKVLSIEGPVCTWSICGDVEFQVIANDGSTQVGKISKQWTGLVKETFTDADNFGITFPMDLDVKIKAVMLGAVFLIDFMFFEKAQNRESDTPGMI